VGELILHSISPEGWIFKKTTVQNPHRTIMVDTPDSYPHETRGLRFEGSNKDIVLHHDDFSEKYCQEKKQENVFRIILIGDSVTQGVSMIKGNRTEDDWRYGARLYQKLNSHENLTKHYEVLNFAMGGYNLKQINYVFQNEALKCDPDLVIYGFFQNDINSDNLYINKENVTLVYSLKVIRYVLNLPFNKFFLKNLVSYRVLNEAMINILRGLGFEPKISYLNLWYEDSFEQLNQIVKKAEKEDINLRIINFPYINKYYDTYGFVESFSQETGTPFLNIKEQFTIKVDDPGSITPDMIHYNRKGHIIVADIVFQELLENSWLE